MGRILTPFLVKRDICYVLLSFGLPQSRQGRVDHAKKAETRKLGVCLLARDNGTWGTWDVHDLAIERTASETISSSLR
jgi:hypothetical protein